MTAGYRAPEIAPHLSSGPGARGSFRIVSPAAGPEGPFRRPPAIDPQSDTDGKANSPAGKKTDRLCAGTKHAAPRGNGPCLQLTCANTCTWGGAMKGSPRKVRGVRQPLGFPFSSHPVAHHERRECAPRPGGRTRCLLRLHDGGRAHGELMNFRKSGALAGTRDKDQVVGLFSG